MPVVMSLVPKKVMSGSTTVAGRSPTGASSWAWSRPSFFSWVIATASAISATSAGVPPAANSAWSFDMSSVVPVRNTSTSISGWSALNVSTTAAICSVGCEV